VSIHGKHTIAGLEPGADLGRGVGGPGPRHEMFEAMVDGAREGLCLLDPGSVMLRSNQVAGEILGFDPKRATGVPVHELGVERDFDWSIVGEVAAGGVSVSTVQTLQTGQKLLVSGVPITGAEGKLAYIVVTIRDITGMGQVMTRLRDAVEVAEQSRATLSIATHREVQIDDIVAQSPALVEVRETALRYAAVDSTVLLLGETGAGKRRRGAADHSWK
jgi:PAS domain S-box-containing protein